jgi:hypothetical protein
MRRAIIASVILLSVALGVEAKANPAHANSAPVKAGAQTALQHAKLSPHARRRSASRSASSVVTYNRDSKDPNVGWHTQGGMRVCTEDCDNPEIPGSGYTCRNVQILGMAMRECDSSN